jgi:hypothetical protein
MSVKANENYDVALGYAQLLKLDGKTDDQVIQELRDMYELTQRDAEEILQIFKTEKKDIYKAQISANIKEIMGLLFFCLIVAVAYFAMASDPGGIKGPMMAVALFFSLGVVGAMLVIFRLLKERLTASGFFANLKLPFFDNVSEEKKTQVLGFILTSLGIAVIAFVYIRFFGNVSVDTIQWQRIDDIVLREDCRLEEYSSGKSKTHFYIFAAKQHNHDFRWFAGDHLYQFVNDVYPTNYFNAGDTITVWVSRDENAEILNYSNNKQVKIYDVAKKYEQPVLAIKNYNIRATEKERTSDIAIAIFAIAATAYHFFGRKKDKQFNLGDS